ncbi:MAG TPA: hypothetical protein VIK54_18975, partial [Acidimicrobiia bacterium]
GSGYWLVASDGGVFAFGTAHFYGSMGGHHLNSPITGIVATADGRGYWLVAKDGGVFNFGDAVLSGSMGGTTLVAPVVGLASSSAGGLPTTGPQGPAGARGLSGATGMSGATGSAGATGPTGPAAAPSYAYIYNLTPRIVAIEGDVIFDSNGPLVGFTHTAGTSTLSVTAAGTYLVDLSASATEPSQFALTVNGVAVPQATYGSGAGTQQDGGQVILNLSAGAVLTLRNHSSASAVTLATLIGGTQANVNASLVVEKLG